MTSVNYKVIIEKNAVKFLKEQPSQQQERLFEAIYAIPKGDIRPLKGFNGLYRLRVGEYRVIYRMKHDELIILVLKIGNRGDIYKKL